MTFTIMDSLKKYIRLGVLGAFCIGVVASCSEDSLMNSDPSNEKEEAGYITFRCADMLETFVGSENIAGTRAGGQKDPAEKAIKTLHVFFFEYGKDEKGNKLEGGGMLLKRSDYDNFDPYQKVENTSFIKIPTGNDEYSPFPEMYNRVHIVAIANIDATDDATSATDPKNKFYTECTPEGMIRTAGRTKDADEKAGNDGKPLNITCYDDLKKWVYYPRIRMNEDGSGDITSLPEAGMPMIGELGNFEKGESPIDLSNKPDEAVVVNLKALMAKVNVSVKLNPDQFTSQYPILKITDYGVRNMPIAVPFLQPDAQVNEGHSKGKPTSYSDYFERYNVTKAPMFHKGEIPADPTQDVCPDEDHEFMTHADITINKNSDAATFSYYTYENINLPDYNAIGPKNDNAYFDGNLNVKYPSDKISESDKQRWKSKFAYSDRASALILKGKYTTHQGIEYSAQFTIYLGGTVGVDPNTDFQVKRNHKYDNNIVIKGLDYIRNSDDDVYNFDGRVNVVDDNPFYLALVNERKVDAHATALPMDVWFMLRENGDGSGREQAEFNHNSTITVELDSKCDWVRMVMIPRAEMQAGGFKAGTGAEDYFTTDLFSRIDNGTINNGHPGRQCGKKVEIQCTPKLNNSRSRVYFYIDENVPQDKNGTNYGDRKVEVTIKYTTDKEGVEPRTQKIEIEQRALLKVSGTWTGKDGKTYNIPTTWMEYYEEYVAHNDPLDYHEQPGEFYNGLPWGLRGKVVYTSNIKSSDFRGRFKNPEGTNYDHFYKVYNRQGGFAMTEWAINKSGVGISSVHLYNDTEPTSAFHYCYGKNKRNSNGNANVTKNSDYSTARGWYMPGIRELEKALVDYYGLFPEFRGNFYWSCACAKDGNYNARATQVIMGGDKPQYELSGTGQNGCQDRKNPLRIRAFYRFE